MFVEYHWRISSNQALSQESMSCYPIWLQSAEIKRKNLELILPESQPLQEARYHTAHRILSHIQSCCVSSLCSDCTHDKQKQSSRRRRKGGKSYKKMRCMEWFLGPLKISVCHVETCELISRPWHSSFLSFWLCMNWSGVRYWSQLSSVELLSA